MAKLDLTASEFRRIVSRFHDEVARRHGELPKSAFLMFEPTGIDQECLPDEAWWDRVDSFLESLTRDCLSDVFASIGKRGMLHPVAGAISRHEPVLRKVPYYPFPSAHDWEVHVLKEDAAQFGGQRTYNARMKEMQQQALKKAFKKVPRPEFVPQGRGLVTLLEHVALYPKRAEQTPGFIPNHSGLKGWSSKARALIVHNLQRNGNVSEEGQASYQEKGCILLPIVSHDSRLIGSTLVIYNRPFEAGDFPLDNLCEEWRLVLDATFAPLLANLNTASASALDAFFLGRVREQRHRIASGESASQDEDDEAKPAVPTQDCFVLNKIALYEALHTMLQSKETAFKLVFFDLDGFKGINEQIGHQFADVLLFHIATCLVRGGRAPFSPQNRRWLFRFGGDEFVGIVPGDTNMGELSSHISQAVSDAKLAYNKDTEFNRTHLLGADKVSCSLGWVASEDLERLFTPSTTEKRTMLPEVMETLGLDEAKAAVYRDMRDSLLMLELADTHTQERVKDFGKGGWLEFGERLKLPFSGRSAGKHLVAWLEVIQWFQHSESPALGSHEYPRKLKSDIWFYPPTGKGSRTGITSKGE